MWIIFKVFIEFVTILLLFYVLGFLTLMQTGSQLLDQGLNLQPSLLEEVKTPGSPGKSLFHSSYFKLVPPKVFFFNCMMFSMHTFSIFLPLITEQGESSETHFYLLFLF